MIVLAQWYLVCFSLALFPARLFIQPPQPALARFTLAVVLALLLLALGEFVVYEVRRRRMP